MSPKKRLIRNRKRLRLVFLVLVLILVFAGYFSRSKATNIETVKPVKYDYIDKIDTKGYLILDEKTYTSQGKGVVDYSVRDGERVSKDYVIANLNLMSDVSDLKDELLKVQSAIEHKNQNLNPSNQEFEISDKEINLISTIQDSLIKEEMPGVLESIETLELNTKKNVDISEISSLINLSNQELEDRRDELSREIATNNIVYKSENSGIVSYKIDNLEEVFTVEKIPEMTYDFIKENSNITYKGQTNQVETGEPLYKIVDNFSYYMAIPVDDISKIRSLRKEDKVDLLINSDTSLSGEIVEINKTDKTGVIVVLLKEKLSEVGLDRQVDVSIIKDRSDSYLVPTSSIVESNNTSGLYLLELNGIVRFRPIKIISQRGEETIVERGDSKGYIKGKNNKEVRTITVFDQIIKDPRDIEEGQIIR